MRTNSPLPLRVAVAVISLALVALLVLPSCGSYRLVSSGGYTFDKTGELRTREESGPIEGAIASLEIDQRFGVVSVEVAAGSPDFAWTLKCWGRTTEDADRLVEEIRLERTDTGNARRFALVMPEDPGPALRGVESHLTVRVPAGTQVDVRNSFGEVSVKGIEGRVSGDCAHCAVRLEDLAAPVDFRTSFDDLAATRIAGGELRNQHGELRVDGVSGDLIAETSFQAARITGVRGTLRAENSHGAIAILGVGGSVTAETSFASLTAEEVAGAATLTNSHGGIRTRAIGGELIARSSFSPMQIEAAGERVRLENSHGAIELALAGTAFRDVEAETDFADLTLRLPAGVEPQLHVDQKHGQISCPLPVHLPGAEAPAEAEAVPRVKLKVRHGDISVSRE